MTEESYQAGRKFMQSVNYQRGLITAAKGDVAKWTNIEDTFRRQLQDAKANAARKNLEKAMAKLKALREKFAAMKFPDSDMAKSPTRCSGCGVDLTNSECVCDADLRLTDEDPVFGMRKHKK